MGRIAAQCGALKKDLEIIDGALVSYPAASLDSLRVDEDIEAVSPDGEVRGTMLNANYAVGVYIAHQYGYIREGVGIAVLDSGVSSHPDLQGNLAYEKDVSDADSGDQAQAGDTYGHGTYAAGIIAGQYSGQDHMLLDPAARFCGVAPGAKIFSYKVLTQEGSGRESDVIDAIEPVAGIPEKNNIRVINLSLGRPFYTSYEDDPLCQAAQRAWDAGIVVMVDRNTGEEFVSQYDIFTIGAGYLDIAAALNNTAVATNGTAESPAATYDEATGEVFLVSAVTAIWGRDVLFGETAIWGRSDDTTSQTAIWGRMVKLLAGGE